MRFRYKEEIVYYEHGEALVKVVQRSCGSSITGSFQGQTGWGSGPVEDVFVHDREGGIR